MTSSISPAPTPFAAVTEAKLVQALAHEVPLLEPVASTPYNATVQIYDTLWVDGTPSNTYAGVDTIGDWAEFTCNGIDGWYCSAKYIAP